MTNAGRSLDEETRAFLRKAFRPFILRRTKSQVATELPEKTEQTLYCDLESDDRKLYNELRDYYRSRLLKRDPSGAPGQFKLQVLEALLRLRQVACHPGLVDKRRIEKGSAKVDTLLAQLDQVLEENHKVLVFSQFTSLLAIVRARLDAAEISYAYLDGRTRDREARVEQFQKDPNTKLFLISLKAGGVGLNLHGRHSSGGWPGADRYHYRRNVHRGDRDGRSPGALFERARDRQIFRAGYSTGASRRRAQ